jgi:hypothetical protein
VTMERRCACGVVEVGIDGLWQGHGASYMGRYEVDGVLEGHCDDLCLVKTRYVSYFATRAN